jgi:hypothetical protein
MPLRMAALSIRPSARASAKRGERSTKPAPERQTVMSPDFHRGPMRRSVLTRSSSGTARTLTWTDDPGTAVIDTREQKRLLDVPCLDALSARSHRTRGPLTPGGPNFTGAPTT